MATYVRRLLSTIRMMRDLSPDDPHLDILLALHDAMAFRDRWAEYTAEQYAGVSEILKQLVRREHLSSGVVRTAIMSLEDLGFDTTPFDIPDGGEWS